MEKYDDDSFNNSLISANDSETNKSFVKKVTSRVSGLIPSSLTKWLGVSSPSVVRQRDELETDEELFNVQPPSKKQKLPQIDETRNNFQNTSGTNYLNHTTSIKNVERLDKSRENIFTEPQPGPSGIQSRKLINSQQSSKLHKKDKETTDSSDSNTSGYSSMARIGSKQHFIEPVAIKSKLVAIPSNTTAISRHLFNNTNTPEKHERSLFSDRSLSPQVNSSLSSRQPSFNPSTFESPSFKDQSQAVKRITNSPFYKGQTTYGGASAYSKKSRFGRASIDIKPVARNSVQIKPVNESNVTENTSLSKTARRILDTLEQYTSPAVEAKKIPLSNQPCREGLLSKFINSHPYSRPSNRELQVPTVPDLLKMKLKERLQDSTVSVRQLATTSQAALNAEEYKIRKPEDGTNKHKNKMKSKITSVRSKTENKETVQELKLPNVQLPISSLPKFDFNLATPFSIATSTSTPIVTVSSNKTEESLQKQKTSEKKQHSVSKPTKTALSQHPDYKFSDPIIIATGMKSIKAINNYKFSKPLCPKTNQLDNSNTIKKKRTKNNGEHTEVKVASELIKTGSVMDILGKKETKESLVEKFKPAEGTWECSVCLIRNEQGANKCAACGNSKILPENVKEKEKSDKSTFANLFKMGIDKWECNACFVRNNNSETKCVACTTPKPTANGSANKNQSASVTTAKNNDFGDKFKPPSSTWECSVCMIRNKDDLDKCAACETLKPGKQSGNGTFGDAFKKKENEWECSSCMVRNSADKNTCLCCESAKPGTKHPIKENVKSTSLFNFGITNTEGFTFGIKPSENKPITTTTAEEASKTTPPTIGFTFGAKPKEENKSADVSKTAPGFSFGVSAKTTELVSSNTTNSIKQPEKTTFTFGSQKTDQTASEVVKKPVENSLPSTSSIVPNLPKPVVSNESAPKQQPTFKFGSPQESKPQPTVSFGSLVPTQKRAATSEDSRAKKKNDSTTNPPVFGQKPEEKQSETAKYNFKPAEPAANSYLFNASTKTIKPPNIFGGTTIEAPNTASASNSFFKFTPTSNKVTETPVFGNGFNQSPATTSLPSFSSNKTTQSSVKTKEPTFSFNQNKTGETLKQGAFSFAAPSTNFSFNPQPATSGVPFNFSANKPETTSFSAQQSTSLMWNDKKQSTQNGGFNFGSPTNNTPKTGFNFGASQATSSAPGLFNFGSTATQQQTGGFNFGSPAPPAFNAEAKPTFNFTGGAPVPTFSAPASSDKPTPSRVIKKGIRRTQR